MHQNRHCLYLPLASIRYLLRLQEKEYYSLGTLKCGLSVLGRKIAPKYIRRLGVSGMNRDISMILPSQPQLLSMQASSDVDNGQKRMGFDVS